MKEEHSNSNWFLKWEDELPTPDELMPLSQTLITPDLAIAFDILIPPNSNTTDSPTPPPLSSLQAPNSAEFDSADLGPASGDEPTRALKRPRLVWTPQLHKRFVDAVAHLGIKNAVPKTIMQLMSVDGLTRENVASHLQKYRLYLKRMQGVSAGGGGGLTSGGDPAMDRLFSSSPVPALFLQQNGANSDSFSRFSALQHHQQFQPPQYRQMGQFGPQLNGHLEHSFLMSQSQPVPRMGALAYNSGPSYVEDVESGTAKNGRRMLPLFPTGDDE